MKKIIFISFLLITHASIDCSSLFKCCRKKTQKNEEPSLKSKKTTINALKNDDELRATLNKVLCEDLWHLVGEFAGEDTLDTLQTPNAGRRLYYLLGNSFRPGKRLYIVHNAIILHLEAGQYFNNNNQTITEDISNKQTWTNWNSTTGICELGKHSKVRAQGPTSTMTNDLMSFGTIKKDLQAHTMDKIINATLTTYPDEDGNIDKHTVVVKLNMGALLASILGTQEQKTSVNKK